MKGKAADIEAREAAFKAYRDAGGNVSFAVKALKELGYSITRPTLYDWIDKYNFKERMARVDLKAQEVNDAVLTTEAQLLASLVEQKEKYEVYFESIGTRIDNQAQFAYQSLVKTIIDIKGKIGADKAAQFLGYMRDLIEYLRKEDPDGVAVIERNFDDFIAHAREKYDS